MRLERNAMLDNKLRTLLTLLSVGSYTKTADALHLTQPAVSHQIKQLEQEYGIQIFRKGKKGLNPTSEGEILIKYARRVQALDQGVRQELEDSRRHLRRLSVGITTTLGEYLVSQIFVDYCNEHPEVSINIYSDSLNHLHTMLSLYQLDLIIVEGAIQSESYVNVLLDTDFLCLAVSPQHPFATRTAVTLQELKRERFILRTQSAGTRTLFEEALLRQGENIRDFNIVIETDNITTIKELVSAGLGVTVMAHSACRQEERAGKLSLVPVENMNMPREINIVHRKDFEHAEILRDILAIYARR